MDCCPNNGTLDPAGDELRRECGPRRLNPHVGGLRQGNPATGQEKELFQEILFFACPLLQTPPLWPLLAEELLPHRR